MLIVEKKSNLLPNAKCVEKNSAQIAESQMKNFASIVSMKMKKTLMKTIGTKMKTGNSLVFLKLF